MGKVDGADWKQYAARIRQILKEHSMSVTDLVSSIQANDDELNSRSSDSLRRNLSGDRTPNKRETREKLIRIATKIFANRHNRNRIEYEKAYALRISGKTSSTETAEEVPRNVSGVIHEPPPNKLVPHGVIASGVVRNVPNTHDIWLTTVSGNSLHPDVGPLFINGFNWQGTAYIGRRGRGNDTGEKFTLALLLVDKAASEIFRNYIDHAHSNNSWHGLPMTSNYEILDKVIVLRNDEMAED